MKILITGHRGLLGSACVRHFSKEHTVQTLDISLFDDRYLRFWMAENTPDWVVHCAAKVGGVKANKENPVAFMIDNLTIQNNVISAAADFGVKKLVNIATSCLYPDHAKPPVSEDMLLTGPFNPDVSAYATAKLAGYELCNAYRSQYGKDFVTVAPCNLYGPNDNYGPSAHVIPALIDRFYRANITHGTVVVWGDGSAIREFLHVDDAARAIDAVLHGYSGPSLINIGSGEPTSIRDLVMKIWDNFKHANAVFDPNQPTGIQEKTFDITKIRDLGWSPAISLEDGIRATIEDFHSNPITRRK